SRRRCQYLPNGTKSHKTSVSPNGRVFLTSIDWMPSQKRERLSLTPSPYPNARLAAACNGTAMQPSYNRFDVRPDRLAAFPAPCGGAPASSRNLPLPET
ncbi:hypothetical protein, partial [Hyphomonas adhaerens]